LNPTSAEITRWFDQEVRPWEPALKAYLRNAFPALPDVDDLVQESYARLFRARKAGEVQHPKAFLFATARNAALDCCRRRKIVSFEPLADFPEANVLDQQPDVSEIVSQRQELELLADAVRSLPERCRQVLTLRLLYDLPVKEIASRLGISALTVKTHLATGMRRCAAYFEERGLPESPTRPKKGNDERA